MSTQPYDSSIRKTIVVAAPLEDAFRVFTEQIGSWWPLRRYSVGEDRAETAVVERKEGGRVYERMID